MDAAERLCHALADCHRDDANAICAAFLQQSETGGPSMGDTWGLAASDARLWADIAPPHELAAYGMAAVDRLKVTPLGLNTRKALFVALWESFSEDDRLRFAKRIDPKGLVLRRGR